MFLRWPIMAGFTVRDAVPTVSWLEVPCPLRGAPSNSISTIFQRQGIGISGRGSVD
jgi:hypothetical protein